ncbi:unnamed protein product [Linum trigynum]|uniref:Uncharacterized protein n=1 Tax=Linum trigynum TaxID=586398 RepID=A0AAV2D0N4_9ROSI
MVTCSFAEVSDLRLGTWHLTLLLQRGAWHHTPLARCLTFSGVHGDSFSQAPSVRGAWNLTLSARRLTPHSFSEVSTFSGRLAPHSFSQAPNLEWGAWHLTPSARRLQPGA